MREIDHYFMQQAEPARSCMVALRQMILTHRPDITEHWKYGMPFYFFSGKNGLAKRFCYLWLDKKSGRPYIGIVDGHLLDNPLLIADKRSRMKVFLVDPNEDMPARQIYDILDKAIAVSQR